MRKLKTAILTLVITLVTTMPAFAMSGSELDSAIDNAKSDVISEIDMTARQTVSRNYPVGAVYTTLDKDIDEDDLYEKFGGAWREINSTFLWAAGPGTNTLPAIDIGERGGKSEYWLSAGIGIDSDSNLAFFTSGTYNYNPTSLLKGNETTAGDIVNAVPVIDEDATYAANINPYTTTIMPPYTVVKMYENVSNEFDDMKPGTLSSTIDNEQENLGIYFFAKPPQLVLKSGCEAVELEEPDDEDSSEDAEQYRNGMRYKVVAF